MIALYLSPVYLLVMFYLGRWLLRWMAACHDVFKHTAFQAFTVVVYLFFATSLLIGFLLPAGTIRRFFKLVGNYWLGVLCHILMTVAVADGVRLVLKHCRKIDQEVLCSRRLFAFAGALCIVIITAVSIYGAINARIIRTTGYEVTINKDGGKHRDLQVVLLADLHLGYNIGCKHMERMVEKINAQVPDLVVIAGDIFDNEYDALDDPDRLIEILKGIESRYGVYACYGNHDIDEKILAGFTFGRKDDKKLSDIRMDEFLEKANIRLLQDEAVLINDSFYLYGRPDYERPGRGITKRKSAAEITAGLDKSRPILVIDHEPRELQELADADVDVDLSGHTHDGQVFPGNLTVKFMWENPCGYLKKDEMHSIVTSGVGLFGPNMRVGTRAEICPVKIHFTSASGQV